ncbi:ribosome small subunit-dependent GTPase A [Flavobacteriaceae bacterium]|nr:ribosome small subunit-dependent GTPase A [Flavobacteriaceae bacterium]
MTGVVIKSTGSWYEVRTDENELIACRIPGKFRMKGIKSTNPVAVGDLVDFELEPNKDTGVITQIQERKNFIVRKSVNLSKRTHIIASNIDRAFLIATVVNPVTFTSFIDRFLTSARAYRIPVVLVFNKVDAYGDEALGELEELLDIYEEIGYKCLVLSAKTGEGIDELQELMQDKVTLFSGHSGVGKSTLINVLEPELDIKTSEISEQHKQGLHTTTFAEMHPLSFGGYIIDTPGIRGFGVVDFEPHEVGDYFPEIFAVKGECKFNNCLHIEEPKCAVKDAVEHGIIAHSRYRSYLQMVQGEDEIYR